MNLRADASWSFVLVSLVACVTLASTSIGCGSSPPKESGTGSGSANPTADDSGAPASTAPGTSDDSGVTFDPGANASSGDASTCAPLNIGILGQPGADSSSNFQAWLVASGTSVTRIQTTTTDPLTAAELAPFDVVILDQLQRDYTTAEGAIFASWVQAGGGFASMSGYQDDPTVDFRANGLLAPAGAAYESPRLDGPVTQFASQAITAGLTSVTFVGGYGIANLGVPGDTFTPLAFLPDSEDDAGVVPVSAAVTLGQGRGFVWGDEWIQYDSEWSTIPQIKQLWVQVFGWIAPSKCALVPPK